LSARIQFGVGFAANVPTPRVIEAAQLAERLDYDVFWVTDSHLVVREAMVLLGALAASTQRIGLGPGVSHLAGRHPSVIASALATLDELAPGRIRLGFGVGDSGPLNLGVARSSLQDLESAVVAIRELLRGEDTPGPKRALRLSYVARRETNPVPIYVAASGKRTLRLAGRVADAALISGIPEDLRTSIAEVRAGELEAGRPAGPTRILFWNTACVDADREAARAAVRGSVARRAMNNLGRALREGTLPEEDREPLQKLLEAHQRGYLWDTGYTDLVPERWIDRLALAGTPDEVRARIEHALRDGADEVSMILMSSRSTGARGSADQLTLFAERVVAPIRAAHAVAA
jgi:alkanesulfonate monooxygenase SsuD/methylene tetrahydromethanopterin reductase-like flavin-dependent oxidoreductase (luciferase family)